VRRRAGDRDGHRRPDRGEQRRGCHGAADRRPAGGETALGEDEDERDVAEERRQLGVVELDAEAALADEQPEGEVEQERGETGAGRQAHRDDGDEEHE
jgi:hypothetical protein